MPDLTFRSTMRQNSTKEDFLTIASPRSATAAARWRRVWSACLAAVVACFCALDGRPAAAQVITGTFYGPVLSGSTATLVDGASIGGNITNDGTLEFAMSNPLNVTYSISGSGNVLLSGTSGTGGTITFSANNSYTGAGLSYGTNIRYGTLEITVGGSVDHAGADLFVGDQAGDVGFLTISGGSMSALNSRLGYNPGSSGTGTISAGTWSSANDLDIGYAGTGALTMTGGQVDVGGSASLALATNSVGTFTISGGTMAVTSVLNVGNGGAASLTMTGGLITSEDGYIGHVAGASGTVSITSGTWAMSRDLKIAEAGDSGGISINSGGVVTVGGELTRGTNGTLDLNAGGTLNIGVGGATGSLVTDIVNSGTLVFNRSTFYSHSNVISGTGSVIKEGAGTLELTAGNSYSGGTTILGGTVAVTATGVISHPAADMVIGFGPGDVGALSVAGVVSSSNLDLYNGTFTVESGGIVQTTGFASIGNSGTGTATVFNGIWTVDNDLAIGVSGGTGTLDITGASAVVTTYGNTTLGAASGDSGTVTVSDNAIWNNYGNLAVGVSGTGALTISGGGSVLVTGTLSQGGAGSTITVDTGGILTLGSGTAATSAAALTATSVTNNGDIYFNAGSFDTSSPTAISGGGNVTKLGSGALTLSGSSSYTGATNVMEGRLYLEGHLGATQMTVSPGAFLGGGGVTEGAVTVYSGTLSPGSPSNPYGTLTVGSLTMDASGDTDTEKMTTLMSISGTVPGVSYDQFAAFDPLSLSSPLNYDGILKITMTDTFRYENYQEFDLFTGFSAKTGSFSTIVLEAAGTSYAGLEFVFDESSQTYETATTGDLNNGGQKLVFSLETGKLVVVPEPGTMALAAMGTVTFLGMARWRRRSGLKAASDKASGGPAAT